MVGTVLRRWNRSAACLLAATLALVAAGAAGQAVPPAETLRTMAPELKRELLEQVLQPETQSPPLAPAQPTSVGNETLAAPVLPAAEAAASEVPRLDAGDTLLLSVTVRGAGGRSQDEFRRRVLEGNPWVLDRLGRLALTGVPPILLAGLTTTEAARRLNAEPTLGDFEFEVRWLPVKPELRPFGYDLFTSVPTTFAPATDIPVPADYVIGPGDTLEVLLVGDRGGRHVLVVGRDGVIDFPDLGPIAVAGLSFESAKTLLEQRVGEQMIGTRASVSMGPLRSIQIFVLGEARRPGSYTVSGLSTITNALFASGGVAPIGSLRDIQLKRSGRLVLRLDLYDLLLGGDTSKDTRLLPGDVIFIPTVGATVAVSGEVQRPAIYEMTGDAVADDALRLAGGLTPRADPRLARVERIDGNGFRTVIDLDLSSDAGRGTRLRNGDSLRVASIRDNLDGTVALEGHVHRSGRTQFRPGMRLTDLVGSLDELKPLADLHYVLIRRESGPDRRVSVVSADLARAFAAPDSAADVPLENRDQVHVFDLATSRDRVVGPILEELERQSSQAEASQVVGVGGPVKVPGRYPLEPGMRVSDLLRAGGGLDQAAYGDVAELTRYEVVNGENRQTGLIEIDLAGLVAGNAAADVVLRPFDHLLVRAMPDWREQETINIAGEVRFPGAYPIRRGETLRSVIQRAGGLTDLAFPQGSVFTRQELKVREQRQLELLAERLQRELAALSLQQARSEDAGETAQAMAAGQALLADLRSTVAAGRLVIELDEAMRATPGSTPDVIVRGGDQLFVPRRMQEVTVIGEVQNPTSHLFDADLTRDDYIERSGGMTQRADRRRAFTIRANGSVAAPPSSAWFSRGAALDIQPGDTVVVPLDAHQLRPLTVWTSVTQILYQIAVAVAAVNSF
ncbi:MAG TPA: SLBB domain-containing protein [Steroidobacteraceae bacterium]|jgi:protein involved in polysaccharide export with SLBB domain